MEKKTENIHFDQWLKDLPMQAEPEGFKPEEMLNCPKCARTSPPTRPNCFYCSAELPVSEAQSKYLKPNLRKLDAWEKGFNIIYKPTENSVQANVSEITKLLEFDRPDAEKILGSHKNLPLARVKSKTEAEILVTRLKDCGVESLIIPDESLQLETVLRRLSGIEFLADKLIFIRFNIDEIVEIPISDLSLIVTGAVFERKIESTELLKRKKESKILDSTEVSRDQTLIDIYTKNDAIGYRIELTGFDFSCLGAEKGLLAKDNINKLLKKLGEVIPNAKFDDNYFRLRGEIGKVWEADERRDASGLERKAMSGYQRKNTITINNLAQFTRYSRLQFQLL
jgi:hypothetical protein